MVNDRTPPKPFELSLIGYIDRFGVEPVMGRPTLSAGEIRRMMAVENVYTAYMSRKQADDWAKWAHDNPHYAKILSSVERILDADSN